MATTNGTAMTVHAEGPALAKTEPTRAFEPRDISEAEKLCRILVASGLLPRGIQKPEAAFAIVAAGRELGLTAMQSLRSIHIIEGKPTLSADLIAALCKSRSDICQYFQLVESTATVARYTTHRRGDPQPTSMAFTWEDAQRAGVTGKDNWKKYPAAMLRARCITGLARAVYPDLAMGIYDPDEIGPEPGPPQRGSFEVVGEDLPAAPVDDSAYRQVVAKLAECKGVAQVNAIAKQAAAAHKAGRLTDAHLERVKVAVGLTRDALKGVGANEPLDPMPTPPPSEPRAEDDGPSHEREPGEEG